MLTLARRNETLSAGAFAVVTLIAMPFVPDIGFSLALVPLGIATVAAAWMVRQLSPATRLPGRRTLLRLAETWFIGWIITAGLGVALEIILIYLVVETGGSRL